jgi:hypothetical protein
MLYAIPAMYTQYENAIYIALNEWIWDVQTSDPSTLDPHQYIAHAMVTDTW